MASIKDVAAKAGVSISTVSNVINGNRYVSEELTCKVQKAIKDLNYETDLIARSMKNSRTMTIGVIITSLSRIFIPQVLNGIKECAEGKGYHLVIYSTNDDFDVEKKYLQLLANTRVDGVIIDTVAEITDTNYYHQLSNLHKGNKRIPVVCIERNLSEYGIYSVYVNNVKGAYFATQHLLDVGCRRIVHISGPKKLEMVVYRGKGYEHALEERGIEVDERYVAEGDFSPISGWRAVNRMIKAGIAFDGIFGDNDQMAIGAIKALNENRLVIPEKVKVIGFDNTFVSSIVKPSLSTVDIPKYQMGWEATDKLCRMIEDEEECQRWRNSALELETKLIVRESTKKDTKSQWELEGW